MAQDHLRLDQMQEDRMGHDRMRQDHMRQEHIRHGRTRHTRRMYNSAASDAFVGGGVRPVLSAQWSPETVFPTSLALCWYRSV
jgi:hypothetical protein